MAKRILMLLSVTLSLTFASLVSGYAQGQEEDSVLEFLVRDEATYQAQSLKLPRSSWDKPLTLRKQLAMLVGDFNYSRAVLVQSYLGGIESKVYDNVDELLDHDPIFLSFGKGEGELTRKQFEINTSIYLSYTDPYGKDCCLVVHLRPRGLMHKAIYTRTTVMLPSMSEVDDFKTFRSDSNPIALSYLTAFDVCDMSKVLKRFDEIMKSTLDKYTNNEELSELEEECAIGIREAYDLSYSLGYGKWLFDNKRYYDAYVNLQPVYDYAKRSVRPGNTDHNELFYKICYMMGTSMWKLGFDETAEYYLSLASFGDPKYKSDYTTFLSESKATEIEPISSSNPHKVTVGDVMSVILDADQGNLREGIINIDGKVEKIATRQEAYNYDLRNLCTPTASNVTLTYTRTAYEREWDKGEDESSLFFENNIILSSVKVADDRWRINVLVPNFKTHDFKKAVDEYSTPFTASFILGNKAIDGADKKMKQSYASMFDRYNVAQALCDEGRSLESIVLLKDIESNILMLSDKERSDAKMKELYSYVLYTKGYQYEELMLAPKAAATIGRSVRLNPETVIVQEYIAVLSNLVDPRVFEIIESQLQEPQADKDYENFLYRRYAFMLIEYGRLDEAEVILTRLLDDPASSSYARQELAYVRSIRNR